jgi:hypothetical protein
MPFTRIFYFNYCIFLTLNTTLLPTAAASAHAENFVHKIKINFPSLFGIYDFLVYILLLTRSLFWKLLFYLLVKKPFGICLQVKYSWISNKKLYLSHHQIRCKNCQHFYFLISFNFFILHNKKKVKLTLSALNFGVINDFFLLF